jgi:hypothetical protein
MVNVITNNIKASRDISSETILEAHQLIKELYRLVKEQQENKKMAEGHHPSTPTARIEDDTQIPHSKARIVISDE